MAKRMILMLVLMTVFIGVLGLLKVRQFQAMAGEFAAMQPPPEAVTTIVTEQEKWPAVLSAIGTVAAVQGVTVSADLPGIVERIEFDSGRTVRRGDVLVQLDTKQEQAQLAGAEAESQLARVNFERMQGAKGGDLFKRQRGVIDEPDSGCFGHQKRGGHLYLSLGRGPGASGPLRLLLHC